MVVMFDERMVNGMEIISSHLVQRLQFTLFVEIKWRERFEGVVEDECDVMGLKAFDMGQGVWKRFLSTW